MAFSLNHVTLAGNMTRDPELRQVGQSQVAKFGLAINRKWKDKDGSAKEDVTFVDVECWGRTAELVAQYMSKGRACYLEGRLRLDKWQTKDAQPRQSIVIVAETVQFLGNKPADSDCDVPSERRAASGSAAEPMPARTAAVSSSIDDEPPF